MYSHASIGSRFGYGTSTLSFGPSKDPFESFIFLYSVLHVALHYTYDLCELGGSAETNNFTVLHIRTEHGSFDQAVLLNHLLHPPVHVDQTR